MIAITMDLEWAPDAVLHDVMDLSSDYDISLTLFSTHDDGLNGIDHERAIHPNFLDREKSEKEILDDILSIYPDAVGLRSHCFYTHSKLRSLQKEFGIQYESNFKMYRMEGIEPYVMYPGIVQFPVYFVDSTWYNRRSSLPEKPDLDKLLKGDGLKVFDFHPPHITYNTPSSDYYKKHEDKYYSEELSIKETRFDGYGVRDLFIDILDYVDRQKLDSKPLGELARQEYRE